MSEGTELVLSQQELTDDERDLDEKIEVARTRLHSTQNLVRELEAMAAQTEAEMMPMVFDIEVELNQLIDQLTAAREEHAALMGASAKEVPPIPPRPKADDQENIKTKDREEVSAGCRALFRSIAAMCHPDKVKDPVLNQIMVLANSHRNDPRILKTLLKQATERAKVETKSHISDRMIELLERATSKRAELEQMELETSELQVKYHKMAQTEQARLAKQWADSNKEQRQTIVAEARRQLKAHNDSVRAQLQQTRMMINLISVGKGKGFGGAPAGTESTVKRDGNLGGWGKR